MSIVFVTGNKGKFEEASLIIPEIEQSDVDLVEIQEIDPKIIISHKLDQAKRLVVGNLVVEDTSLYLDCLNGLPGPLIKWFMKTIGNEGLVKIVESYENSKAVAKVVIGYSEGNVVNFFEGSIEGMIVKPRGENGFGWDSIFQPTGFDKTFGEMAQSDKNDVSMRKIAFQKLKEYLG